MGENRAGELSGRLIGGGMPVLSLGVVVFVGELCPSRDTYG